MGFPTSLSILSGFHLGRDFYTFVSGSNPLTFKSAMASSTTSTKPIVLHIGDPVRWNTELYAKFSKDFTVIRPSLEERERDEFMKALKEKRWGDFSAIFRPFWNTGGEMGRVRDIGSSS